MSTSNVRPRYSPVPCTTENARDRLMLESGQDDWIPIIQCPANFSPEVFDTAVSQLIHHPEYNSTLILRSATLSDTSADFPTTIPRFDGLRPVRNIHRKLLPRRPGRDAGLEQDCTLYASDTGDDDTPIILVLTPILEAGASLPYYHPTVRHLAFRYIAAENPLLRIEIVPLPATPTDLNSRIYRTCLALLDTLHRYGWGALTNYKKRVHHDCIIPREEYQDLYLVMRERHKHLVSTWHEVTDPLKHVFEDIGIATFLILLWKHTYGKGDRDDADSSPSDTLEAEPWKRWPRPPVGFVDLGCGNGLLTHILTAEEYDGHGIDVRSRTSWSHYPEATHTRLHVESLDPSEPLLDHPYLRPGVFIIANHADELTPWTPVLSTLVSASGYLSIPCCAWAFDAKYERESTPDYPVFDDHFVEGLNLGGDGSNTSSYSRYRIWLATLSLHCGWQVECETLRIPSTRNWAIIGRNRTAEDLEELEEVRRRGEGIVARVRERGLFKTRTPEGKTKGH
ncbi:hypothetical protein LXA43DRAFT_998856 [Ganoderma leucocontextum]|nr:hypothetical protein LXA43DRAFT_998856 [Ganoderma leucocontextum]